MQQGRNQGVKEPMRDLEPAVYRLPFYSGEEKKRGAVRGAGDDAGYGRDPSVGPDGARGFKVPLGLSPEIFETRRRQLRVANGMLK